MDDNNKDHPGCPFSNIFCDCALFGQMLAFKFHPGADDIQKLEIRDPSR